MRPRLAIVAYPRFSAADQAVVQAVRARHDPQFDMLDPHFTLVFPVEMPLDEVVSEARSATSGRAAFLVTLQSVQAARDASGIGGHVFLVPGPGAQDIATLSSTLYGGMLKRARRVDIPYVPHITVGASSDFSKCEALATELARDRWDVTGAVEALSVVELVGGTVTTKARLLLGGGG